MGQVNDRGIPGQAVQENWDLTPHHLRFARKLASRVLLATNLDSANCSSLSLIVQKLWPREITKKRKKLIDLTFLRGRSFLIIRPRTKCFIYFLLRISQGIFLDLHNFSNSILKGNITFYFLTLTFDLQAPTGQKKYSRKKWRLATWLWIEQIKFTTINWDRGYISSQTGVFDK